MMVRGVLAIVMLTGLVGCRDLVGFDEPSEAGADVQSKAEPLLPFVPAKELRDGCEACATTNCNELRDACLGDDVCAGILRCTSGCKDPACFARCGSYATFGGEYLFSGFQVDAENLRYSEYKACVAETNCRQECGTGLNWKCVGSETYRWPTSSSGPLPVQLSIYNQWHGWEIPAHVEASDGADGFLDRGDTGTWAQVELDLNSNVTFDGYFTIVPKLRGLRSLIYHPGTLFRPSRGSAGVVDASGDLEPHLVSAGFSIIDCLGYPASGVSFEIDGMSPQSKWILTNEGSLAPGETTTKRGTAAFEGLTPQADSVTVRAVRRDRVVARRSIYLREGFTTRADLRPLSGDE